MRSVFATYEVGRRSKGHWPVGQLSTPALRQKMKRTLVILLMLAATPASAADMTLCHQALAADESKYTDDQYKSTLCMASKVYQHAAKIADHEATSVCMKALEKMMP